MLRDLFPGLNVSVTSSAAVLFSMTFLPLTPQVFPIIRCLSPLTPQAASIIRCLSSPHIICGFHYTSKQLPPMNSRTSELTGIPSELTGRK